LVRLVGSLAGVIGGVGVLGFAVGATVAPARHRSLALRCHVRRGSRFFGCQSGRAPRDGGDPSPLSIVTDISDIALRDHLPFGEVC